MIFTIIHGRGHYYVPIRFWSKAAKTMLAAAIMTLVFYALPARAAEVGDKTIVIETLIGEAKSEGTLGMQAVAEVIRNRADKSGRTMSEECLLPYQFSFWNNRAKAERFLFLKSTPTDYDSADAAFHRALEGSNLAQGARHFYAARICMPKWADGKDSLRIGRHVFIKGVE